MIKNNRHTREKDALDEEEQNNGSKLQLLHSEGTSIQMAIMWRDMEEIFSLVFLLSNGNTSWYIYYLN